MATPKNPYPIKGNISFLVTFNSFLATNRDAIKRIRNAPSIRRAESCEEDKPLINANFATGPLIAKQNKPSVINKYPVAWFEEVLVVN